MNEFDSILQQCQARVDRIYELLDFHREKESRILEITKKHVSPHPKDQTEKRVILRFLVVEDLVNKQWFVYDSGDSDIPYMKIPFGDYTIMLLNGLHGKMYYGRLLYDETFLNSFSLKVRSMLNDLSYILSGFKKYKDTHTSNEVINTVHNLWILFRYCVHSPWGEYIDQAYATATDFHGLIPDENVEEMLKVVHEDASEMISTLHKIISERFFVYYDYIIFKDGENIIYGKAFATYSPEYIFSQDLLHVLSGTVPSPRMCPRCKMLYFSDNYKIKYCPDCRQDSKKIHAENRKKNPYRYLHKQITDLLNNFGDGSENFREESNYYWAIVRGEKPKSIPKYINRTITTKKAYYDWLIEQKRLAKLH